MQVSVYEQAIYPAEELALSTTASSIASRPASLRTIGVEPDAADKGSESGQSLKQQRSVAREVSLVLHGTMGSSVTLLLSPDTAVASVLEAGEARGAADGGGMEVA
eukprot:261117-Pelagomonas_calceolata.AAC.8